MKRPVKYAVLAVGLLAAGALRGTWENAMTREFRMSGLLDKPVGADTRDHIGQTSAVVAFGGLRTLVATFLNLRATTFFSEQRWSELGDAYDTIVDLAPHTRYYWENGSWYQTNNAASYYAYDSELPPLRRKELWRMSIKRGRAFLERGIRNNPDEPNLRIALGRLLVDPYRKILDYSAAADAFKIAADTGKALPFVRRQELFALARAPGRGKEALALARELQADPANRVPTLECVLFALEYAADPSMPPIDRALSIFESSEQALEDLSNYWLRDRERFPLDGVAAALQDLERRLAIPREKSVFIRPKQPMNDPAELFLKPVGNPPLIPQIPGK